MKAKNIFLFAVTSLIFFSCTKHRGDYEENIPSASITFEGPAEGTVFHYGDSITITAKAISTALIHGYELTVRKAGDTNILYTTHIHDHNDTLLIRQGWKNNITGPAKLEAGITLTLDHDGHTLTRKTLITVQ
jgi:hypothetical protein